MDEIQAASSAQFGKQSHRYARGHILENIDDVKRAVAHITLPTSAEVLDVACGVGYTGLHFARLGHGVTFSDLTPAMLERAREKATAEQLEARFHCHAAEELPYADASFDLVTCRVAPHHFSSPASFIQEVSRVLKPKGFLILIDGTVPDDHEEAEAWLHDIEKLRDPSHHRLLTPRAWSTLCETHGLRIQQLHLERRQQPDLQWYFETANTPPANRQEVLKRIETAPRSARELFEIDEAEGKITWWWSMLTLVAQAE